MLLIVILAIILGSTLALINYRSFTKKYFKIKYEFNEEINNLNEKLINEQSKKLNKLKRISDKIHNNISAIDGSYTKIGASLEEIKNRNNADINKPMINVKDINEKFTECPSFLDGLKKNTQVYQEIFFNYFDNNEKDLYSGNIELIWNIEGKSENLFRDYCEILKKLNISSKYDDHKNNDELNFGNPTKCKKLVFRYVDPCR